jgi:hypothetical protein
VGVARRRLPLTTMLTGLLRYLLDALRYRGGALLDRARKGLDTIRALLGAARGLIRPLLKKAVAYVTSKVAPAAAKARDTMWSALESLKAKAEAAMKGRASPPEGVTAAGPEQPTPPVREAATWGSRAAADVGDATERAPLGCTLCDGAIRTDPNGSRGRF